MKARKHKWVRYDNPRNGLVHVTACVNCGVALDGVSDRLPCQGKKGGEHRMTKLGWVESSKRVKKSRDYFGYG
ncbi:MAG: hypothetical protein AAF431_10060 [Pseudomonadota bacterium]